MELAELVAEVTNMTKRPDLASRINSAVRTAILKAHNSDFYYRDLRETGVTFDAPRFVQNFNPKQVFPTFRKAKYIRYWNQPYSWDPTMGQGLGAGPFLESIMIEQSLDSYGVHRNDVFYMAGELLQMRMCRPQQTFIFGGYVFPIITEQGFDSWIAREYPDVIILDAARKIFSEIGLAEQSAAMREQVAEQYQIMRVNSVADVGE